MFVDKVQVGVKAGKGGDGAVSFRREKFVERGGPDGGDGGKGGDIVAVASNSQNTLADFRYKKKLAAEEGKRGDKQKKHGKNGQNQVIKLPVGTVISNNKDEKIIADLIEPDQEVVIARGGQGGFGNAHFVSSRRQAPRVAEVGEPGEEFDVTFELKMIADVGLVGLPNAGKSTLLSKVSNARPVVADYPFTTLKPNLGVVDIDSSTSVLFADIPGLIKGASRGKGLGDEFLRHVERTKLLVHIIDAYQEDIAGSYKTICDELASYSTDLSKRPQIVALNKTDGLDREIINYQVAKLKKAVGRGIKIFPISAQSGQGTKELLFQVKSDVKRSKVRLPSKLKPSIPVISLPSRGNKWEVKKASKKFIITGPKIEKFARRTNFDNEDSVARLRDIMRKMGIIHELERKGVKPSQTIEISDNQFKY